MRVMGILKFRRLLPCENAKSKSHATPTSSPSAATQPVAQADAGCAFGSVARHSHRAA